MLRLRDVVGRALGRKGPAGVFASEVGGELLRPPVRVPTAGLEQSPDDTRFPIFKVAPFAMTLMESGLVMIMILTGIVYASNGAAANPTLKGASRT